MIFLFLKETNMGFLRKVNSTQPCLCWRKMSARAGRGGAGAAESFLLAVCTASFDQSCSSAVTWSEKLAGSLCGPPSLRLSVLSPVPRQQPLGNFTCPHLPDLPHLPTFQAVTLAWKPSSPHLPCVTSPVPTAGTPQTAAIVVPYYSEKRFPKKFYSSWELHTQPWERLLIIWLTLWVSATLSKPWIPQSRTQDPLSFLS